MSSYIRSHAPNDSEDMAAIGVDTDELKAAHVNLKRAGSSINQRARAPNIYWRKGYFEERTIDAMRHVSITAYSVVAALSVARNSKVIT